MNADLPCATPDAIARLAAAGLALVEAATARRTRSRFPTRRVFAPLYGPGSAARFRAHAPFATVAIPELEADVDTEEDLERLARLLGPRTRALLAVTREGRPPLRRRRRRPLRARSRRTRSRRESSPCRQRRRRPRDPRPARLAGPRQPALHASRACSTRSGAGAARARAGTRSSPPPPGAARTGSGSATSTSGSTSCARRRSARARRSPTVTAELVERAGVARRILPATDDPLRTHVLTPAGQVPVPGVVRRPRPPRRGRRVDYEGADARARLRPACVDALAAADAILIAPSNPYLSIGPDPGRRGDPRRARAAAGPLRRGQPARRRRGRLRPARPYALAHGGRHDARARRRLSTTGLIDALVIDEADAPAEAPVELVVDRHAHARPRRRLAASPRRVLEAACA